MRGRVLSGIFLVVVPAVAGQRQFANIRVNQSITVALPTAQCEAKVVRRDVDQLTLVLKKTTPCGPGQSIVTLARVDVDNVIDERPSGNGPDPGLSTAGHCTLAGTLLVAAPAGFAAGGTARSNALGWTFFAAGVIGSDIFCHMVLFPRAPRYSVFASQLTPAAKVP